MDYTGHLELMLYVLFFSLCSFLLFINLVAEGTSTIAVKLICESAVGSLRSATFLHVRNTTYHCIQHFRYLVSSFKGKKWRGQKLKLYIFQIAVHLLTVAGEF